ncbi:hypothetical protein HUJ05_004108 [Dendroctonus ponderosae]|nr:hypothetical protein HUJ05_004108 [Dendroctonus ponderosae]
MRIFYFKNAFKDEKLVNYKMFLSSYFICLRTSPIPVACINMNSNFLFEMFEADECVMSS